MRYNVSRVDKRNRSNPVRRSRRTASTTSALRDWNIAWILHTFSQKTALATDASAPRPPLLNIPPEIQLHVVSYLPAKDIQRCRRVNKHFHELIDSNRNHDLGLKPGIDESLRRLNESVARFCFYPADAVTPAEMSTAFLRAFADFFHNTLQDVGFLPPYFFENVLAAGEFLPTPDEDVIARYHWLGRLFLDHWTISAPQGAALSPDEREILWCFTMQLARAASFNTWPPADPARADFVEAMSWDLHWTDKLCQSNVVWPMMMLDAAEKNLLDGQQLFEFAESPVKYRLVEVPTTDSYYKAPVYLQKCRALESRLADLLQVPHLPPTAPVTYCTKSRSAAIHIKMALEHGEVLTLFKRSALLEDLVIA
ncbi:hypothetical protein CERZMDRAFT_103618 [Cercospora zeae-maydis SCOH1-5]|uniref:F-box domain-containing protein n=1 Tax=Cercospora zeae-maydis SCOH1-5 TaxID=717836 RepID=A0A6A6EVA6_9PEZI|nr:hypothetical protein CERZMDRAFT_103618 [Cercospora zeae-maydis SCOH1-5]